MLEGLTQDSLKAMKAESTNENENNYSQDNNKMTHESLKPGPQLDKVVSRALKKISSGLDGIGPRFEDNNLFLWIRDIFTSAITYSFFGSNDPFLQDPTLVQSFWSVPFKGESSSLKIMIAQQLNSTRDYENDVSALMFAPLPWLSARHAYLARERVQASLRAFFNKKYHLENDCSVYARGRIEVALKHGFTTTEAANVLIGIIFVSTINTIPTAYWLLIYILSDALLDSDLLEEVESIASRNGDKCVLDIDNITVKCPVLVSAYQEVMRLTNHQTGLRQVIEDTQLTYEPVSRSLDDSPKVPKTYLLRKGCFVQTPAAVLHASTAAWGPDVASFNPRRFLPSSITSKQKKSFVPFGGGRHLCPGRHLAFSEILGTVAMLLLGYEVRDISGGAVKPQVGWKLKIVDGVPRPNSAHLGKGFKDVKVRRKKGWENVSWGFRIGGAEF